MPATITSASPTGGPLALSMYRAKTALFSIAVLQADGNPQDLTDSVLFFHAQVGLAAINKSSPSSGITIDSVTGGLATLQIDPADTLAVPFGGVTTGPCELTMQTGSNNYEVAAGALIVNTNVSVP